MDATSLAVFGTVSVMGRLIYCRLTYGVVFPHECINVMTLIRTVFATMQCMGVYSFALNICMALQEALALMMTAASLPWSRAAAQSA
jgi:hypothetical protein